MRRKSAVCQMPTPENRKQKENAKGEEVAVRRAGERRCPGIWQSLYFSMVGQEELKNGDCCAPPDALDAPASLAGAGLT